jgi:hypothetical protein
LISQGKAEWPTPGTGPPSIHHLVGAHVGDDGFTQPLPRTLCHNPARDHPRFTVCRKVDDAPLSVRRTAVECVALFRGACRPPLEIIRIPCIPCAIACVGPIVRLKVVHGSYRPRREKRRRGGRARALRYSCPLHGLSFQSQTIDPPLCSRAVAPPAESSRPNPFSILRNGTRRGAAA